MDQPRNLAVDRAPAVRRTRAFDLAAVALVFLAYSVTLGVANDLGVLAAMIGGAANTVPVIVFGAAARRLIVDRLVGRRVAVQLAGHLLVGAAYALFAFWLVLVLLGLVNGASPFDFVVEPFPNRAMAWQLLENVTTYGIIAAVSYLQARPASVTVILSDGVAADESRGASLSRYFIRSGDDILPIDVGRIVGIAGADDYAEVVTLDGRHLVRMTLAEFERALDPARFVRIHRSHIVNLEQVARAEPAGGGRLLLHMSDGEILTASRTGSRRLRDLVI